ncbi:MAG: GNAT family N-acetyltransferase [Pseudomonadota bacterium]
MHVSLLQQEEIAELDAFLALHAHSSLYLRAELRHATGHSNFAIARLRGRIVATAAQVASGMLVLQAPVAARAVAAMVLRSTGRRLAGFFGPLHQVQAARQEMGLADVPLLKDSAEDLFALALPALRLPPVLAENPVRCRVAGEADVELLVAWRYAFRHATLKDAEGAQLERKSRADIAALLPSGCLFLLEGPEPLACCSFNARLPDTVQIGNVWTPPHLRGNGYGRGVVAGALAIARDAGVTKAILSTGRQNLAAQAAYRAIGFQLIGDYATATISPETRLPGHWHSQ